jgi:D-glycero-D-manno-heptose 1,7-bisphosphate phosphatase
MGIGAVTVRAVFLDRDGVINRAIVRNGKPYPPTTLDQLEVIPDAPNALSRLHAAGFRLIVVTNQPDVARGTQTRAFVESVHAALLAIGLPIDSFRVCYHDDPDHCDCRKPKPGLLLAAAREDGIDLKNSYLVGDRWRDIEAGEAAGCRTVFIDQQYSESAPARCDAKVKSLAEAADWILKNLDRRNS